MIVVATADFELYHEAVGALRDRGVAFTTIEPGDPIPDDADVVIATRNDEVDLGGRNDVTFVAGDADDPRAAVDEALAVMRGEGGRTVVGVDPGPNPGIAVLVGDMVVAAFQVPVEDAAEVVIKEVGGEPDALVRVGDGDRLKGARVIRDLGELDADLAVELVDETGTTPYLDTGPRGMADMLAAVNIAHIPGERVEEREIEPTQGELQRIKDESRRQSGGELTVDEPLARRVAAGDLTVSEAVEEHRNATGDDDG